MQDGLVHTGNFRCMADFLIQKLLLCDADVFPDGPGEKEGFLKDHSDVLAQILAVDVTDVRAADGDASASLWQIVQAVQKMDMVDLPLPVVPRMAKVLPAGMVKLMFFKIG